MVGPQQISFGGDLLAFHLPRTLHFLLLSFNECSLFLELRLAFVFHLDFCSDLVLSFVQRTGDDDVSRSLEGIVNVQKEMAEERKHARSKEMEENWLAGERKPSMDERLAATEKRKAAMEETLSLME
jgi:hypothetical protein